MLQSAIRNRNISVLLTCQLFVVSESYYRHQPKLNEENNVIADWLIRITDSQKNWGFTSAPCIYVMLKALGQSHAVILMRSQSVISEVSVMKNFVGLDVSHKKTSVYVIGHNGNKIRMANVDTHPGVIADYLFSEGFDKSKIDLETGPLCVWLYHSLKGFGLDIDCIHARHIHAALSMQLNKTAQHDAFSITRLVLSGWYQPVHVKNLEWHQQRLILTRRKNSVFERAVLVSSPSLETIKSAVMMLLDTWEHLSGQIRKFNYMLENLSETILFVRYYSLFRMWGF